MKLCEEMVLVMGGRSGPHFQVCGIGTRAAFWGTDRLTGVLALLVPSLFSAETARALICKNVCLGKIEITPTMSQAG